MLPSGRSSQRSSICALGWEAVMNFSSGCVSVGNEILVERVLLSDIASIASWGAEFWLPSFFGLPTPAYPALTCRAFLCRRFPAGVFRLRLDRSETWLQL